MNLDELKDKYTMRDILARYGLEVRKGFTKCPFHKGDRTASLKVYDNGFYCFGCGKGGDIIRFVQEYEGLNFRDACKWISGEELDTKGRNQVTAAELRREFRDKNIDRLKKELKTVNSQLSEKWKIYQESEPFSDEWTEAYNTWQLLCYKQEDLFNQLEEE